MFHTTQQESEYRNGKTILKNSIKAEPTKRRLLLLAIIITVNFYTKLIICLFYYIGLHVNCECNHFFFSHENSNHSIIRIAIYLQKKKK